jgi:tRNA pseudouridine65 synthase
MQFDILFEDSQYVAINKPFGWLVHRTRLSEDTDFILQRLRNQLNQRVYPVHRLDRATSGVLIFGKNAEAASALGIRFQDKQVEKKYLAVVRGHVPESDTIDYALADPEVGQGPQPAITHYRRLGHSEIPEAIGLKYPTARFALVEAEPETGRRQQIRKHFAHIFHPVIGDKRHGDCKHNKYFEEKFQLQRMLLHAWRLRFFHPENEAEIHIFAPLDTHFLHALDIVRLQQFVPEYPSNPIYPGPVEPVQVV